MNFELVKIFLNLQKQLNYNLTKMSKKVIESFIIVFFFINSVNKHDKHISFTIILIFLKFFKKY